MKCRSPSLRRGLTLVEMAISIPLVGIALVAALNTVGTTKVAQFKVGVGREGHLLAQALMSELLQQDYADVEIAQAVRDDILSNGKAVYTPGPDNFPGNDEAATGDRSLFDDVDDYDGWSASPPQAKNGSEYAALTGWERTVSVDFAKNIDKKAYDKDYGIKRITVTVTHNGLPAAKLVALKTIGLAWLEACCLDDGSCEDLRAEACAALGGTAMGPDTICATTVCSCLVAHWEFEEGGGSTAADSAGNHNATFTSHGWTTGRINGGLSLSGDGGGVVAYDPELFASGQLTVMGWFNSGDDGGVHTIFSNGTTGDNTNPWFGTWNDELDFGFYDGGWREVWTTGLGWQKGVWYHAAATFDSTTDEARLYLNGVEVIAGTIPYELVDPGEDLMIGNSQLNNEGWEGILDDLRIYNCVLEADEILAIATGSDDVCGDASCGVSEDPCTCPTDCGAPTAFEQPGVDCADGIDNDCDGDTDCDDINCAADPACTPCLPKDAACSVDSECCSGKCDTNKGKCKK